MIKEERFYGKENGWVVSGAIDRLIYEKTSFEGEEVKFADIEDYKCTSVWSVVNPNFCATAKSLLSCLAKLFLYV